MTTSILVPIDGSPFSEQALPTAVAIARRTGARLQLVRVHEPVFTGPPFGDMPAPDPAWDREMRLEAEARLRELARRVMKAGVEASAVVVDGPVASALANYVEEVDADLVVMTTHGRNAFSRAWLGSVADVLVRKCTRPVLLLRPGEVGAEALDLDVRHAPSFDHILIPTDGSAFSKQVVGRALALARPLGARLTLLRVVPTARALGMDPEMPPPELARRRVVATEALGAMAEGLVTHGLRVRTAVVAHDDPPTAILEYAREHGVGLIAMTTHGRSGLARLALGSVADQVLRGTETPLLLYRPVTGTRSRISRILEREWQEEARPDEARSIAAPG